MTLRDEPSRALIIFKNPDKLITRSSGTTIDMPQWPFRLVCAGPPNSGKGNMLLNLIFQLHPPPSAIHIIHYDPHTTEYNKLEDIGVPIYYYDYNHFIRDEDITEPEIVSTGDIEKDEIISNINFASDPLVIIDEITRDLISNESEMRWERLMNFTSSHRNTTVLCSIQSLVNLPPKVRRAFNQYVLWKQTDKSSNTLAATRAGIPPEMLNELFQLCHDKYDSIWIDCDRSMDDVYRFRLNMSIPITTNTKVEGDTIITPN
jgi:hypothetical protein